MFFFPLGNLIILCIKNIKKKIYIFYGTELNIVFHPVYEFTMVIIIYQRWWLATETKYRSSMNIGELLFTNDFFFFCYFFCSFIDFFTRRIALFYAGKIVSFANQCSTFKNGVRCRFFFSWLRKYFENVWAHFFFYFLPTVWTVHTYIEIV